MTEEQKARRAEAAREHGAKSRGPVSDIGKYISSLNSIALLSTDCRLSYLRLY